MPGDDCMICGRMERPLETGMSDENRVVAQHLINKDWTRGINLGGEVEYTSPDYEYQVLFSGGFWVLGKFTDSDLHGVATGRYATVAEGLVLEELVTELAKFGL